MINMMSYLFRMAIYTMAMQQITRGYQIFAAINSHYGISTDFPFFTHDKFHQTDTDIPWFRPLGYHVTQSESDTDRMQTQPKRYTMIYLWKMLVFQCLFPVFPFFTHDKYHQTDGGDLPWSTYRKMVGFPMVFQSSFPAAGPPSGRITS